MLIRKEEDKERLKHFTKYQHHVRNKWRNFRAGQKKQTRKPEDYAAFFEKMFADMYRR